MAECAKSTAFDSSCLSQPLDPESEEARQSGEKGGVEIGCPDDCLIVDDEATLRACLDQVLAAVRDDPLIALDCEGENLSRKGKLLLMAVATRDKAFLIDILSLQALPFDIGFRAILEDKSIKKLVFDCRSDADALQHQYHVTLDGVLDIQLLEVIKRPAARSEITTKRRSERHEEVVRLMGQKWCIENILADKQMLQQKQEGSVMMDSWGQRPLKLAQLNYAKTDVRSLFHLYDKLSPNEEERRRLDIASGIYVALKRSIVNRKYDRYEDHGYLPMDVIPERGQITFPVGNMACVECKRRFPGDEFSKTQIRNGVQKCRTCKKVKLDNDVHENRQDNIARDYDRYDRYDQYDYYESSDNEYGGLCGYESDHAYGYDSDGGYGYGSDW